MMRPLEVARAWLVFLMLIGWCVAFWLGVAVMLRG